MRVVAQVEGPAAAVDDRAPARPRPAELDADRQPFGPQGAGFEDCAHRPGVADGGRVAEALALEADEQPGEPSRRVARVPRGRAPGRPVTLGS